MIGGGIVELYAVEPSVKLTLLTVQRKVFGLLVVQERCV